MPRNDHKKSAKPERATPIVKRVVKGKPGHHGGSWKIAYADFVTAMMAFFLLMWLLGSTTQGDLEGIAEYFKNPLKVSIGGGSGSGDSSSVIKGGGRDLTRRESQIKKGEIEEQRKTINLKAADAEIEKTEISQLRTLKHRIEKVFEASSSLREYRKQMLLDITSEGLRIQLVDAQNRPMFASGSAELLPHMRQILQELSKPLNEMPNRISLSGHTDATPYSAGERAYSNWELSADRANASRRQLVAAGLAEGKVLRVVGLSSAALFDKADPLNPVNRRISIIVLTKKAEESMLRDAVPLPAPATAAAPAAPVERTGEIDKPSRG
ncbi:MAG: flagellar motor protein MotB [Rhodospirillaceae bacterium]